MSGAPRNRRLTHDTASPGGRSTLLRNIGINVVLPWLTIQLLTRRMGLNTVTAYAGATLFPLGHSAAFWVRERRIDPVGMVVLPAISINIVLTLVTHDVRFALLKASPVLGMFGVACLVSLPGRRPVMFFVSRYLNAGSDTAKAPAWTARLQENGFRHAMRRLTLIWGAVCVLEVALSACVVFLLRPDVAIVLEPVIGIATIAGLLTWTTAFARRRAAAAAAAAAPS